MIAELIAATGEARVIDLARRLGVTHVTVARTIQRLQRDGLVTTQPYRSIFLTAAGRACRRSHDDAMRSWSSSWNRLAVPALVAQSDAEGIEHHVSAETLRAFVNHLRQRKRPPVKGCGYASLEANLVAHRRR